ncbi:uncharacterized protein LOC106086310 isoform X1 [Stomoxys calcitrans]|uniref:uncharacterized protein LOC106086310 isoform X1 n=1 Tax=Stomoxys calcitrans TaxID=35570 RepID=UPI0027E2BD96|nr:uncharacterized protein LOC106086310 isoform X1 [Stomoxys calcitrans]
MRPMTRRRRKTLCGIESLDNCKTFSEECKNANDVKSCNIPIDKEDTKWSRVGEEEMTTNLSNGRMELISEQVAAKENMNKKPRGGAKIYEVNLTLFEHLTKIDEIQKPSARGRPLGSKNKCHTGDKDEQRSFNAFPAANELELMKPMTRQRRKTICGIESLDNCNINSGESINTACVDPPCIHNDDNERMRPVRGRQPISKHQSESNSKDEHELELIKPMTRQRRKTICGIESLGKFYINSAESINSADAGPCNFHIDNNARKRPRVSEEDIRNPLKRKRGRPKKSDDSQNNIIDSKNENTADKDCGIIENPGEHNIKAKITTNVPVLKKRAASLKTRPNIFSEVVDKDHFLAQKQKQKGRPRKTPILQNIAATSKKRPRGRPKKSEAYIDNTYKISPSIRNTTENQAQHNSPDGIEDPLQNIKNHEIQHIDGDIQNNVENLVLTSKRGRPLRRPKSSSQKVETPKNNNDKHRPKAKITNLAIRQIPRERLENTLTLLNEMDHQMWEERNTSCLPSIHRYGHFIRLHNADMALKLKCARQFLLRRDFTNLAKILCLSSKVNTLGKATYYPALAKYGAMCLAQTDQEQFNSFMYMLLNVDDGASVLKRCTQFSPKQNEVI